MMLIDEHTSIAADADRVSARALHCSLSHGMWQATADGDVASASRALRRMRAWLWHRGCAVSIEADGRPKIVVFLAHWCPHCQAEVPRLVDWFGENGVPDDVDYANIPWRNNRFDENALTAAVATEARAQNALDQYRKLRATRTVATPSPRTSAAIFW